MKKIKYYSCYMDFAKSDKNSPPFPDFILAKLNQKYEFVWAEADADYYIWFEGIYSHFFCFNKFRKLYNVNKINIFTAGEAFTPDLNLFDYIFSYDANIQAGNRFHRLLPAPYLFNRHNEFNVANISFNAAKEEYHSKQRFCNFIYSNPSAPSFRDELFHKISEYKLVNSLGSHLNNTPNTKKRGHASWYEDSIDIKKNYRFSIACENAYYPGCTSEKILSSFEARTIPIYWGNPLITEEFNPKAFINCHDYNSIDEIIETILDIENDESKWINMLMEPKFNSIHINNHKQRIESYINAWDNIFSGNLGDSNRLSKGTFVDSYRKKTILSNNLTMILIVTKRLFHRLRILSVKK